jgi:hypothetical protein
MAVASIDFTEEYVFWITRYESWHRPAPTFLRELLLTDHVESSTRKTFRKGRLFRWQRF